MDKQEMTVKEAVEKLKKYLTTQDSEIVCTLCAHLIMDVRRFMTLDKLPKEERENLLFRSLRTIQEMEDLLKNGPHGDLELHIKNS